VRGRWQHAAIAVLASFFGVGLGQLYAGRPGRALTVLLACALLIAAWGGLAATGFAAFAALVACGVALGIAVLVDAARCAYRPRLLHPSRLVRLTFYGVYALAVGWLLQSEALWVRSVCVEPLVIPAGNVAMEPTLLPGDYFVLDRRAFAGAGPRAGDVVGVVWPRTGGVLSVRRTVGGETDAVAYDPASRRLLVNGAPFERRSVDLGPEARGLAPGTYFLLGDNADRSRDPGRLEGVVPRAIIAGRAAYIYFSREPGTSRVRWERVGRRIE
jgi:signal peptidase I